VAAPRVGAGDAGLGSAIRVCDGGGCGLSPTGGKRLAAELAVSLPLPLALVGGGSSMIGETDAEGGSGVGGVVTCGGGAGVSSTGMGGDIAAGSGPGGDVSFGV